MENLLNSPAIVSMDIIVKSHKTVEATTTRKGFVVLIGENDNTNEAIELICNNKAFEAIAPILAENPDAVINVSFEKRIEGVTGYVDANGLPVVHTSSTNSVKNITESRRVFTKRDALVAAPQAAFNLASAMFAGMVARTTPEKVLEQELGAETKTTTKTK